MKLKDTISITGNYYNMELPTSLLSQSSKKQFTLKKFLILQQMELSGSNIKKCLIFSQKKAFFIFLEMELFQTLGNRNPEKFLTFQERYI